MKNPSGMLRVILAVFVSHLLALSVSAQAFDPALLEHAKRQAEQASIMDPGQAAQTLEAATTPAEHRQRFPRPIPMGVSISTTPSAPFIFTGTAGMLVRANANPSFPLILSNNHVMGAVGPSLCPNTAPAGTWVLQPGTLDIGFDPGNDPFYVAGVTAGFMPIDFSPGANNLIDAALAFTTPALAKTEIFGIGEPNQAFAVATAGMPVTKSGRTTGVTAGTVQTVNLTSLVNYGDCGTARFIGQFSVTPGAFSDGGDSGSAILNTATNTPVGLLFAGSATTTIANHLFWVYVILQVFPDGTTPAALTAQMSSLPSDPRLPQMRAVQARAEDQLFRVPGVVGVGIGQTEDGSGLALIVYCKERTADVARAVPSQVEGVPVRLIESGEFRAF